MKTAIGIDIGGSTIKSGIITSENETKFLLDHFEVDKVEENTIDALRAILQKIIDRKLSYIDTDRLSLGISTTGSIDMEEVVHNAYFFSGYDMVSWKNELSKIYPRTFTTIRVMNDGNAAAWAQYKNYDNKVIHDFIHISVGTGVGGGIIIDDRFVLGSRGKAGEIGHITIGNDKRKCPCGSYGCVEAYCGTQGILQTIWALDPSLQTSITGFSHVLDFLDKEAVMKGLEKTGQYLGIGASSLIRLFNPSVLTLGGGVMEALQEKMKDKNPILVTFMDTIEEMKNTAFVDYFEDVHVGLARLGNQESMIGAALYSCL